MAKKYPEYKQLNFNQMELEILDWWKKNNIFEKSISERDDNNTFTFYEGPPSANGKPGIHHVMARTIKDVFCRYKTLSGYQVHRKGGWDTHGLPVELQVEKALGITKEDIGTKITVAEYNQACRTDVMKYKSLWEELTDRMGYWLDMENPYVTFEKNYIETLWSLLKRLFDKGLLYKGYTIQPFSPAAGTGLSSHELNQPGCYRDVKDTSCIAQFLVKPNEKLQSSHGNLYFIAWTTTPWTLPSNSALAVGKNINYVAVQSFNRYTAEPITVILAKALLSKYFNTEAENAELTYNKGDKQIPWRIDAEFTGSDLEGIQYEQLMPYVQPEKPAFRVIIGDFVSTEDGTGIVHIAPTFGADDFRVAAQNNIPAITVKREINGVTFEKPLVTEQGTFVSEVADYAGMQVKDFGGESSKDGKTVDELISIDLKLNNKVFKVEKYEHSYPHCWRTDKPVLYYPLDSWFIKTTAYKERMLELNNTINWKPKSTGTGRFGNWLENLVDWNLSRSRYWGTPLPIWVSKDQTQQKCIGSIEEFTKEIALAYDQGIKLNNEFYQNLEEELKTAGNTLQAVSNLLNNEEKFDLHRPYVDQIVLAGENGEILEREPDLIDVWFDSGAMPFAQWHYPFENLETFAKNYPADFIAEGVDQTRGWFFTLHAISVLLEDSVAYKNVISNGLVLDKNGNKMSKRLGNAVDPFETLEKYGADITRWYMLENAAPWENLKFNIENLQETQRKFFGTLQNTYSFFALYANIDGFTYSEAPIPVEERPELDQWIISLKNTLIKEVDSYYADYEPTKAARAIQNFVIENLSNWYIRLSRRRFWKSEDADAKLSDNTDKLSAYQTLYECMESVIVMMSPISPFYTEKIYQDLNAVTNRTNIESVHLQLFPKANTAHISEDLENKMKLAQEVCSLGRSIRRKEKLKVRQPLQKIMIPIYDDKTGEYISEVSEIIKNELNIKEIELLDSSSDILEKEAKVNFKTLGKKLGKKIKSLASIVAQFGTKDIIELETKGSLNIELEGEAFELKVEDVEIKTKDIPGWSVASNAFATVALDIQINDNLKKEGLARELVNKVQNIRKNSGFEVTDTIAIHISENQEWNEAFLHFTEYVCDETLATALNIENKLTNAEPIELNGVKGFIKIHKN